MLIFLLFEKRLYSTLGVLKTISNLSLRRWIQETAFSTWTGRAYRILIFILLILSIDVMSLLFMKHVCFLPLESRK